MTHKLKVNIGVCNHDKEYLVQLLCGMQSSILQWSEARISNLNNRFRSSDRVSKAVAYDRALTHRGKCQ